MRTVLILLAIIALPAQAAPIYKCVASSGKVTYSESPCYGEDWHRMGTPETAKRRTAKVATEPRAQAAPVAAEKLSPEVDRTTKAPVPSK